MNAEAKVQSENVLGQDTSTSFCGIVMPIAAMGDYSESHWLDVQSIIKEAVSLAGYEARLVSESVEATVIIRSIVQNVYSDEMVVCDVSGMNPNVMFELGMRLAFDKPVVIIKDDATRFSFDINTIEHLEYPKSLRYQTVQQFKIKLSEKIKGTLKASKDEDGYRSFLSNFGSFTVANLKDTTLNESEALERILNKLDKFDSRLLNVERLDDRKKSLLSRSLLEQDSNTLLFEVVSKEPFNVGVVDQFVSDLNSIYGDAVDVKTSARSVKVTTSVPRSKYPYLSNEVERIWNNIFNEKKN
jgi:hypothetical protein